MSEPVTDDEVDFAQPQKAGKQKKSNAAPSKPQQVETPPVVEPVVEEPPKSRFHPKTIAAAESFGISPEDIEACETRAELQWLIDHERTASYERNQKQMGRARGSDGPLATESADSPTPPTTAAKPAPVAEVEEEWAFESDMSMYDETIRKELGRMGKLILKASKGNASKSELAELQKKLDNANTTIEAMQASNSPVVKRANAVVQKYSALFGDTFDDGGFPPDGTDERDRFDSLLLKVRKMHETGKATGIPEKDIPAAIAALFPGSKPGAAETSPEVPATVVPPSKQNQRQVVTPPKPAVKNRIEEWNDAGQAVPTGRNGGNRTGMADDIGAKKEIAKGLAKMGLPTENGTDEDDEPDF